MWRKRDWVVPIEIEGQPAGITVQARTCWGAQLAYMAEAFAELEDGTFVKRTDAVQTGLPGSGPREASVVDPLGLARAIVLGLPIIVPSWALVGFGVWWMAR